MALISFSNKYIYNMGGGSFYNHNIINNMNNYIPLTGQSQQQSQEQQTHDEQEQRRQQYHNRVGRKKKKKGTRL